MKRLALVAASLLAGCFLASDASNLVLAQSSTLPATAKAGPEPKSEPARVPDVVFVPTPQEAVEKMLKLAQIKKGEVVYDLGCGDGRIVVTAAKKYGVKAVGFDIDPKRVKESRENARTNKVEHLVTIKQEDIFKQDLSAADVVTLYLLPELNVKLMPQLRKLKPGSRIISFDFDMRGAKPQTVVSGVTSDESQEYTIYKWVVPWEAETTGN